MNDSIDLQLGLRIKQLREAAQLTQADLAAIALKSVETISNFERGKTAPSVATLSALARYLNCSVADFFNQAPQAPNNTDPLATMLVNKSKLLGERDRQLLVGFLDLLVANSRR